MAYNHRLNMKKNSSIQSEVFTSEDAVTYKMLFLERRVNMKSKKATESGNSRDERCENLHEEQFFRRLTELRMQKGVSARDMSLSIGQNCGYINHIENKQAFPSLPVFFNICDYFHITPEQFFSSGYKDPSSIASITENLKTLNPEQLQCLDVIVRDLSSSHS